jgi:prepilin-type N-terminal cleavage/methylation domain-containing protein
MKYFSNCNCERRRQSAAIPDAGVKHRGFTLIELLVALGLMSILMVIVATIFSQSIGIYNKGSDLIHIYGTARSALDNFMVKDLNGCLPLEGDQQRFEMGEDNPNADSSDARDWISFRATAVTSNGTKGARVKYYLAEETDTSLLSAAGSGGAAKTLKSKRTLYVLRRQTADFDGKNEENTDLCHFVLSFNIEVFDTAETKLKQLKDTSFKYPIGDNKPENEKIPRGIRVSLRVVANAAERTERIIQREIWIPVGQ